MSASLSALAHAGCPATSLRRSCVGICLVIKRRRCTSTVARWLRFIVRVCSWGLDLQFYCEVNKEMFP